MGLKEDHMKKTGFKVGDRVKAISQVGSRDQNTVGYLGIVYEVADTTVDSIGVRFAKKIGGGDLGLYGHRCAVGHGWYVDSGMIQKVRKVAVKRAK